PVYWAHRGGSSNWSEMTQYAYDNAVAYGAKVLEFSSRRSSDGVQYGMHDNTLDRVTPLSGPTSSLTWAELENTPVTVPNSGGVLLRLDDFIERYTKQILLIDPKSGLYLEDEFIPLLKSSDDWLERSIITF